MKLSKYEFQYFQDNVISQPNCGWITQAKVQLKSFVLIFELPSEKSSTSHQTLTEFTWTFVVV